MPAHVTLGVIWDRCRASGSPQPSSDRNGRNSRAPSSVASHATSAITISATNSQTTTLNGVTATRKGGGHALISKSKSRSRCPPREIAQRVGTTEDSGATDDEPAIGGLQDEDESLERAAALASPVKGLESRNLTKVDSTYISLDFSLIRAFLA